LTNTSKIVVKHIQHPGYTSAMASGAVLAGPSPDGFVHITYWREGMRLLEEKFEQEVTLVNNVEVAKMKSEGNISEHFREDVATILLPVAKLDEICNALCKMRDNLAIALAARDQVIAAEEARQNAGPSATTAP
jgi:hypothetical protein